MQTSQQAVLPGLNISHPVPRHTRTNAISTPVIPRPPQNKGEAESTGNHLYIHSLSVLGAYYSPDGVLDRLVYHSVLYRHLLALGLRKWIPGWSDLAVRCSHSSRGACRFWCDDSSVDRRPLATDLTEKSGVRTDG